MVERLLTENRAHAVCGRGGFNSGSEMEAHGVTDRLADLLAAFGDQLLSAAQFLTVVPKHDAALVDEAKQPKIAVVARFQPTSIIVLGMIDRDVLDSLAKRTVGENVGRIRVGQDERRCQLWFGVPGRVPSPFRSAAIPDHRN